MEIVKEIEDPPVGLVECKHMQPTPTISHARDPNTFPHQESSTKKDNTNSTHWKLSHKTRISHHLHLFINMR